LILIVGYTAVSPAADEPSKALINEILANPDRSIGSGSIGRFMDEDGELSDWIELHNPGLGTLNLEGYFLSDDPSNLAKWRLPASSRMPPGGYLVVFASGKDRGRPGSELHTNFNLSTDGEFLALTGPDGVIVDQLVSAIAPVFPPQRPGVSYGRSAGKFQYFERDSGHSHDTGPTPGTLNNAGFDGFADEPEFSHERGFYNEEFELTIESNISGVKIRYTTNGERPTENHGVVYTKPVTIGRTTPIRAVAYKDGWKTSDVATHTFIFVDDVVRQYADTVKTVYGFADSWGNIDANYGMNQSIVEEYPGIKEGLRKVPTMSLVLDRDDMFDAKYGIYSHPESKGPEWERAVSLEILDPEEPEGTRNIQVDSGIRIQGGAFRRFNVSLKKSFRLFFKREYGASKMLYDLFPGAPLAAHEFDSLVLRMVSNDGYQWERIRTVQYARDEFARRTALDLGIPAGHGRYMQIYINGVYWGLYNVVERPDAGFARSYLGVEKDEWDGLNSLLPINDAKPDPWNDLIDLIDDISENQSELERTLALMRVQGLDVGGHDIPTLPDYIDIDNYIDYMLVNWYLENKDWPKKNHYIGRQRDVHDPLEYRGVSMAASEGFKFFMWDAEVSMELTDIIDNTKYAASGVAEPQKHLQNSGEYRVRFGDRAHRALFNDGALTPWRCAQRYDQVTRFHTSILVPEIARWGDQHGDEHSIKEWEAERDKIRNHWCDRRTEEFLRTLRTADPGLYPMLDAPRYDRNGGVVPSGTKITVIVPETATDVVYTLGPDIPNRTDWRDDLDPRLPGGDVNPKARRLPIVHTTRPTAFLETGAVWKYLDDGSDQGAAWRESGFDDSKWKSGPSQLGYGENDENTVVGFIDVNPQRHGTQHNATTYFRKIVDIPDPAAFSFFQADILYDDAYVIYVNGQEVARHPSLPENPAFDAYTRVDVSRENALRTLSIPAAAFKSGANTIAVEIHQVFSVSSDISFDLTLTGRRPAAIEIAEPVADNVWLKSRTYDAENKTWSAMNAAFFSVNSEPAHAGNIVISRIGFDPKADGLNQRTVDGSRYEFVELMNVSTNRSVDLTGVSFVSGIRFDFEDHTFIEPGGRIIIVNNRSAFEKRFGEGSETRVFGRNKHGNAEFRGNLDNAGERIALHSHSQGVIHSFDFKGYHTASEGLEYTLVLLHPESAPDHGRDSNWLLAMDPQASNL